jgi:hypothetical protein
MHVLAQSCHIINAHVLQYPTNAGCFHRLSKPHFPTRRLVENSKMQHRSSRRLASNRQVEVFRYSLGHRRHRSQSAIKQAEITARLSPTRDFNFRSRHRHAILTSLKRRTFASCSRATFGIRRETIADMNSHVAARTVATSQL